MVPKFVRGPPTFLKDLKELGASGVFIVLTQLLLSLRLLLIVFVERVQGSRSQ